LRREENRRTRRKPLGARARTNNNCDEKKKRLGEIKIPNTVMRAFQNDYI